MASFFLRNIIYSSVVVVSSSQILIWIRFYCYQKFHHSIVRLFIHSSQSWAYVLSFEESNLAQIYAQKLIVTISYESNIFQKQKQKLFDNNVVDFILELFNGQITSLYNDQSNRRICIIIGVSNVEKRIPQETIWRTCLYCQLQRGLISISIHVFRRRPALKVILHCRTHIQ